MKNGFIQLAIKGTGLYLVYTCFQTLKKQYVVKQARDIREHQIRYGGDVQLSQQKKAILLQADQYMQGHAGLKYINRVRTKQALDKRVGQLLQQKKQQYKRMKDKDQNDQELQKILLQINQLNKAYKQVKPKYTKLKDMEQPQLQEDVDYFKRQK